MTASKQIIDQSSETNLSFRHRQAFTLIELLVVITIIGILAALLTVVIGAVMRRANETVIQTELNQITAAVEFYKTEYQAGYPPSTTARLKTHVRNIFPRATQADIDSIPNNLTPAEILWFVLRGYTSDPYQPVQFANTIVKRKTSFEMKPDRILPGPTGAFIYVPQGGQDVPYVYFDVSRTTPPYTAAEYTYTHPIGGVAHPYKTPDRVDPSIFVYADAGKYQIISAGLDGLYGNNSFEKIYPLGDNYNEQDDDNLVNFSGSNLGDSKP
ncbi:MAG: type II secretion system protein [Planctomycetota bacterium]|nr:type II secretion system protein [Planctomycetota bacterium]